MLFHNKLRQRCITTLYIEKSPYMEIAKYSIPLMVEYAETVGASFHVINTKKYSQQDYWASIVWEKFQIIDLLKTFSKVLYLDLDCVVGRKCPDIFEYYKHDSIVCYFDKFVEDPAKTWMERSRLPEPKIRINSGVMLLDRSIGGHLRLPEVPPIGEEVVLSEERWFCACFENSKLGVTKMDQRFNDVNLFGGVWIHHALMAKNSDKSKAVRAASFLVKGQKTFL